MALDLVLSSVAIEWSVVIDLEASEVRERFRYNYNKIKITVFPAERPIVR